MSELSWVHAAFGLWPDSQDDGVRRCADFRELESRVLGGRIRRIGAVSRMAAVAARACLDKLSEPVDPARLGVFHGTAMGDVAETAAAFEQATATDEVQLSPLNFSNAVGIMPLFHAARVSEARGPAILVTQEDFSFEGALRAALDHASDEDVQSALVGASDGYAGPRAAQAARLELPVETLLGEGSAWLCLRRASAGAIGRVLDTGFVSSVATDDVFEALGQRITTSASLVLLPGARIDEAALSALTAQLDVVDVQPYLERSGAFHTASALAVSEAFASERAATWLHVTRDPFGSLAFILFAT